MKINKLFLLGFFNLCLTSSVYVSPLEVAKPVGITAVLYLLGGWTVGVPALSLLRGVGTLGYSSYNFFKNIVWVKKWIKEKVGQKAVAVASDQRVQKYGLTCLCVILAAGIYFYISHSELMKLWNVYKKYKDIL